VRLLLATLTAAAIALVPISEAAAYADPGASPAGATRAERPAPRLRGLERELRRLHCEPGRVDGRINARTRAAVYRLQTRHGLVPSGKLTRATRALLRGGYGMRCDRRPLPRGSGKGRGTRLVVSQHQNWVWLVRGRRVVGQAPMIDNPRLLRPGTYATGSYCGRPARVRHNIDLHHRYWLDHFVRFAPCGFAFHRIPRWRTTGRQLHPDWWLGTDKDLSDGCIRLSAGMAERVWRFTAGRRTTVRVV